MSATIQLPVHGVDRDVKRFAVLVQISRIDTSGNYIHIQGDKTPGVPITVGFIRTINGVSSFQSIGEGNLYWKLVGLHEGLEDALRDYKDQLALGHALKNVRIETLIDKYQEIVL